MVEYCAARGGTEEDAVRYGLAAHGVIDKVLVGVGFAGVKTLTKRGKRVRLTKVDAINLSKKTYRDKVSAERINQTPYNPRSMEALLKTRYAENDVTSTTMTGITGRNVKLSGKSHHLTGIPFTQKGAPIFDSVAVCDVKLSREIALIYDERRHKVFATKQLKNDIANGRIKKGFFNKESLEAIQLEQPVIPGFTWHHHEDFGRMQLIPRKIHEKTGHDGGMKFWPFNFNGDVK